MAQVYVHVETSEGEVTLKESWEETMGGRTKDDVTEHLDSVRAKVLATFKDRKKPPVGYFQGFGPGDD